MFRKTVRQRILKKKPSLSTLLHETLQKQWDEIKNAMNLFSYFDDWSEEAVHQCCVHSNILHYSVNEIVLGKDDANVDVSHFILEGTVIVVMRMLLEKYRTKYHKISYKLHKDQSLITINNPKLKPVFMQICRLNEGACFGFGEKLSQHIIIANSELKCLVVPRSLILRNKTLRNVWERIIINLDMNTPSLKQIFFEYKESRRRLLYSRDIYKYGYYGKYKRIPVNTSIHDVPLTLRSDSILCANKCKEAENHPLYLIGEKKEDNNHSSNNPIMEELKDILSCDISNDYKSTIEESRDVPNSANVTNNENEATVEESLESQTNVTSNDNVPIVEELKDLQVAKIIDGSKPVLEVTEDVENIDDTNVVLEESKQGDAIEISNEKKLPLEESTNTSDIVKPALESEHTNIQN